jgi:hypothetical protein
VLVADCPDPPDLGCAHATCTGGACGFSYAVEDTPCGHAGTCDGAGTCDDVPVLQCTTDCDDGNECTTDFCDNTTGQCVHGALSNLTTCDAGEGHCSATTASCCHGLQVAECIGIDDPTACLAACVHGLPMCSISCVVSCPAGTTPIPSDGLCLPL